MCITESWLNINLNMEIYQLSGYNSFYFYRRTKVGYCATLFIDSRFLASQLSHDVTTNNAYNMCTVIIDSERDKSLVIAVYGHHELHNKTHKNYVTKLINLQCALIR